MMRIKIHILLLAGTYSILSQFLRGWAVPFIINFLNHIFITCNFAWQKSILLTFHLSHPNILEPLKKSCKKPPLHNTMPGAPPQFQFSNVKLEKFPHSVAISGPAEASAVCSCPFGITKSNSNIPDMDKAWASIIQQASQLCRESSMPKQLQHRPASKKACI